MEKGAGVAEGRWYKHQRVSSGLQHLDKKPGTVGARDIEHLPGICKNLASMPSTGRKGRSPAQQCIPVTPAFRVKGRHRKSSRT